MPSTQPSETEQPPETRASGGGHASIRRPSHEGRSSLVFAQRLGASHAAAQVLLHLGPQAGRKRIVDVLSEQLDAALAGQGHRAGWMSARRRCDGSRFDRRGIKTGMSTASLPARALARAFRPFAKVEASEAISAAAMMVAAFLLLSAYYLLKTVREPLILLHGGAEVKLYARAAQAVLMVGVVQVYGELARRVGRKKLLAIVFLFFISNLLVFAVLARAHVDIGLAFFLWVGVFSYTSVAQFWALAADIYTEDQGKRLFPIIGIGSSVGAVAGSRLAASLVPFGPDVLMGAAAVLLVLCVGVLAWIESRAATAVRSKTAPVPEQPLANESALHLLLRDRYLLLIAGLIVLLNWCNSAGEYLLDRTLLVAVADARARGMAPEAFVGSFKATTSSGTTCSGCCCSCSRCRAS